ncbi:PIGB [Lepeophtheirus salmonis]|uniref:Mannosyltransferase n=1 Tax=Lepeophtheirus salmonis TaxID=72036 RepID=A0A7R8CWN0_LEPSM|nr:PIGB [Lepeophtheirus salmonis]CAF2954201.1 PIGB [Lepeophtheirus salmonis]
MPLLPIFLLRTFAAIISVSWHVPDEIWQSSEIAHYIVFGYGYKTWEWRDNAEIRSYIHPTLFLLFAILGFSLIGHKEHRFILPLLPVFLLFGGQGLALWRSNKLKKMFLFVYVLLNFLAFTYLSLIHQSGSTHVMYPYLRQGLSPPANSTVLFLMPCHSTPYQSYLHRPDVNLRFLTCEPGIGVVDEAEEFYSNPPKWLTENNNKPAEIIILFNRLAVELNKYLVELSYDLQQRIFHSHFGSGRIGEEIWVYRSPIH